MTYRVYTAEDGRKFVRSKDKGFTASFCDGKWSDKPLFNAYEMQELLLVTDAAEARKIVTEAEQALAKAPARRKAVPA